MSTKETGVTVPISKLRPALCRRNSLERRAAPPDTRQMFAAECERGKHEVAYAAEA